MVEMNQDTRKMVCRMVGGLLTSDTDVDDRERAFLDKLLVEFNVPTEEWDAIFPLMEAEDARAELERLNPEMQQDVFQILLSAATADESITDEEEEYLRTVGQAIGLSTGSLDALMKQHRELVPSNAVA